jgi:DsbC/DsbD-like thiol-disulfide interchange protein
MRTAAWFSTVLAVSTLVALADVRAADVPAAKKQHAVAESLASVSAIKPGEPFKVGVRFKIDPGWHVYWINPGESGQATEIKWTFPEGYKVSRTEYPTPINFPQPGDVKGYGYLGEVMLMATVTPPADAKPGAEVPFSVKAGWLVCSDEMCIPGKAKFDGKLAVAEIAKPANEDVFKQWNQQLPVSNLAKLKGVVKGAKWQQPDGASGPVELVLSWADKPPAKVEWFVGTPDSVLLKDAKSSTEGSESRFTFTPTPVPEDVIKVPAVVAYTDAAGKRQGVEFTFKIGKNPAAPKGQAAASRIDPQ